MATAARLNILTMDGGGIRGISSLLILRALMKYINQELEKANHEAGTQKTLQTPVTPQDVFPFAAGTSTGGLIAIMLIKLGMSLEDCITAYEDLSKRIFGDKTHIRGTITRGLWKPKYSGSNLKKHMIGLMKKRAMEPPHYMFSESNSKRLGCAVICREFAGKSKYSTLKKEAVPICSFRCPPNDGSPQQVRCCISDAARATSAAPTYFPIQIIDNRYFADGGLEYNNPSEAILHHYCLKELVDGSRGKSDVKSDPAALDHECDLDFRTVRIINFGTGTKPATLTPPKREILANLVLPVFRMGNWVKQTLTEMAVDSEKTASSMRALAHVSSGGPAVDMKYERFSADNGVCFIKMDKYKYLPEIRRLTEEYLAKDSVIEKLEKVAKDIAKGLIRQHHLPN